MNRTLSRASQLMTRGMSTLKSPSSPTKDPPMLQRLLARKEYLAKQPGLCHYRDPKRVSKNYFVYFLGAVSLATTLYMHVDVGLFHRK